ncbi:MAG: biosynthetic arginine decarboxylase [Planctomycetota bacterium]
MPESTSRTDPAVTSKPARISGTRKPPANRADKTSAPQWSVSDSVNLYGVDRWGHGYFGISEKGNVVVHAPTHSGVISVELTEIIDGLQQRGLTMPVMLRLENLVHDRIKKLNHAFRRAIDESGFTGTYRGIFPVKVNQQSHVVEEIARAGKPFGHGLEAGSKAELLIAISTLPGKDSTIICNGFKDEEFIDLGLQAIRLGFQCFFVAESLAELDLIIQRSRHWNIEPFIGLRLKLSTKVDGYWSGDSGDRSLFGLKSTELIRAVDLLREENMLDRLMMLHYHLGSQIPNIRNIRDGVAEACRFYLDLASEGAPLGYFNLGGGLAVDYDGNGSTDVHSRNYDLDEYCIDIVETIMASFDRHGVGHPEILTESGRWTVAPMSILMFNVLHVADFEPDPLPEEFPAEQSAAMEGLIYTLNNVEPRRLQENYNDAVYNRDKMRDAFRAGEINLRELALAENICLTILHRIADIVPTLSRPSRELMGMCDLLSDIYYGNFSVFQSLPDAWAIGQVFPVMPLHRLNEMPDRRAIVADLTCDCDGKLDKFTGPDGEVSPTLRVHQVKPDEDYLLGVFLVGAYQETLGDLHNLFGDTHVVSVRIDDDGQIEFVRELQGDSIENVLSYVEYQTQDLYQKFHSNAERAVRDGRITVAQRQQMIKMFRDSLSGYTYFER